MIKEKNVTIKGVEYKLKKSFGVLMTFEDITKKNSLTMQANITDIAMMCYATLLYNNKHFKLNKQEFIELLDEDDSILDEYTEFLTSLSDGDEPVDPEKKSQL